MQDTVRVEIDLGDSGLSYEPGDALGVYAQNSTEVRAVQLLQLACTCLQAANSDGMHAREGFAACEDHASNSSTKFLATTSDHGYALVIGTC